MGYRLNSDKEWVTTETGLIVPSTAAAHTALMGPTSGGSIAAVFRAIEAGDLPLSTLSALGILMLAGDLRGTADSPEVYQARGLFNSSRYTFGTWTDGQYLKIDGSTIKSAAVSGGGGGAMAYLGRATVAGSATTSLQIAGLDLNTDGLYFGRISFLNALGSTIAAYLEVNADATLTNYERQSITGNGASAGASRANSPILLNMTANSEAEMYFQMSAAQSGKPRYHVAINSFDTTSLQNNYVSIWHNSTTNVTSIELVSGTSSGIAVGTFIDLWKAMT